MDDPGSTSLILQIVLLFVLLQIGVDFLYLLAVADVVRHNQEQNGVALVAVVKRNNLLV